MNTPLALLFQRMRTPLIILISAYAIAIAGFTIIPGITGDGETWRMSFLHALYVVSYTGSTIGFGEIPHEFSDAQRMWTIVCIYLTVFAWLYAIGSLISLAQDEGFRQAILRRQLERSVRQLGQPFFIVCGYGGCGRILVHELTRRGRRAVVMDRASSAIRDVTLTDHGVHVPGFNLDASVPDHLLTAGLQSRWCAGLLAVTDSDRDNLKIAINGRLLNRRVSVVGRADDADVASNMASFDTDHIIRPADEFARRVSLAITRPAAYRLYDRLTEAGAPEQWEEEVGRKGTWILCGFNRFGRALHERLEKAGVALTVIDDSADRDQLPENSITGRSSEGDTLKRAGVEQAVGLIAAHASDAENLSTIMTARMLNDGLLVVARENHLHNRELFAEAETDLASSISSMLASAIRPILEAPLVVAFIERALEHDDAWIDSCLERLEERIGDRLLEFWSSGISERRTPALAAALEQGVSVRVGELTRDPGRRSSRLPVCVLMVRRDGHDELMPADDFEFALGDRVVLCGTPAASGLMRSIASDPDVLHYLTTGETRSGGWLWRRVAGQST